MGSTRVRNNGGIHYFSEYGDHIGYTERTECYHPYSTIGLLNSPVLELGWIALMGSVS